MRCRQEMQNQEIDKHVARKKANNAIWYIRLGRIGENKYTK